MRFADIKFGYTSGGPNLIGGYMLQILRPDRFGTFELFTLGCGSCYEDLSFLTWCMDKNRPLPPGKPFDPFREKDFQRRKREKFPPPLVPGQHSYTGSHTRATKRARKVLEGVTSVFILP